MSQQWTDDYNKKLQELHEKQPLLTYHHGPNQREANRYADRMERFRQNKYELRRNLFVMVLGAILTAILTKLIT